MAEALNDLLKATSRSFYLTLRVLPAAVRPQIGLAYLLARTTDTIADTESVPLPLRLHALGLLRERILGLRQEPGNFTELMRHQELPAERKLLEQVETSLARLPELSPADQGMVRTVLDVITGGQRLDLQRFTGASAGNIIALQNDAEMDDYTYRVAGCVGEFWTQICRAHVFPKAKLDDQQLLADGIRFGKGLQLINILRDLPKDLRNGRCYLPADRLAAAGLKPADLLSPDNEGRLRPLYDQYLDLAEAHLTAGWAYTNTLPWRCLRVRLACAWPVLIGAETIRRLRSGNVLDARQRIKVSRRTVRGILLRSLACYPLPGAWQSLFQTSRKAVASDGQLA